MNSRSSRESTASLVLAVYALRNQLTGSWPECRYISLKNAVEQGGVYLGENAFRTLIGLLEIRQRQAMTISADAVTCLLKAFPALPR
jgi:putative frv operon regulatory protein